MKRRSIFISTIFVFFVIFAVVSLYAQKTSPGLVVHPSNFDITYNNKVDTQTITLDNKTDQPVTIHVDLRNFTANGEEGSITLTKQDTSFSLASWIHITPTNVTIPAQGNITFTFTITPPVNAEAGGHFGSIVFVSTPPPATKGSASKVSQEVAALILFEIPGNALEKARLLSFTPEKSFYEFGPVTFFARVYNEGVVHIAPVGQIVVKGTFGDTYFVEVNPYNILPHTTRKIPAILPATFLLGHYTAHFVTAYGSKNEQMSAYAEFDAFPVRYALIILGIFIVLFLLRKRLKKAMWAIITGK